MDLQRKMISIKQQKDEQNGVRNPMHRDAAGGTTANPNHEDVTSVQPEVPSIKRAAAAVIRSIKSAAPAVPAGNMEYSLCMT